MPGTPLALVLFLFLIVPGIVYVLRRESLQVTEDSSAFRDTAVVALVSAAANALTFFFLLVARMFWPPIRDHLDRAVSNHSSYFSDNYSVASVAFLCFLVVSSCLAFSFAQVDRYFKERSFLWHAERYRYSSSRSSWHRVFDQRKSLAGESAGDSGAKYFVECWLEDGSLYRGIASYFNPSMEEGGSRDLIIQFPLEYKPSGSDEFIKLGESSQVVVSAGRVMSMIVTVQAEGSPVVLASDIQENEGERSFLSRIFERE